jgi:Flp pilus assembly protein TadD
MFRRVSAAGAFRRATAGDTLRCGAAALLLLACACTSFQAARLYQSGTEALRAGDAGRAVQELERAAALEPDASEIQNHLGLAYAAAGRGDDARRAFERALALDCDNAAARHNLAAFEARAAREEP